MTTDTQPPTTQSNTFEAVLDRPDLHDLEREILLILAFDPGHDDNHATTWPGYDTIRKALHPDPGPDAVPDAVDRLLDKGFLRFGGNLGRKDPVLEYAIRFP